MDMKKYGNQISLVLAMGIIFLSTIPQIRHAVGFAMDFILGPLLAPPFDLPFYAIILILSALTGLYSSLLQKYTIDYERLQEVQEGMKEFQKEYRDAQLSKDERRIKKLESKRDKMMKEQLEVSQEQFKPMAYILLVSIPIFLWLIYKMPAMTTSLITFPYFGPRAIWNGAVWIVPAWILWVHDLLHLHQPGDPEIHEYRGYLMKITVSGPPWSGTTTLARSIAGKHKFELISAGEMFRDLAEERGLSVAGFGELAEKDITIDALIDVRQKETAKARDNIVVEGRLSGWMVE